MLNVYELMFPPNTTDMAWQKRNVLFYVTLHNSLTNYDPYTALRKDFFKLTDYRQQSLDIMLTVFPDTYARGGGPGNFLWATN